MPCRAAANAATDSARSAISTITSSGRRCFNTAASRGTGQVAGQVARDNREFLTYFAVRWAQRRTIEACELTPNDFLTSLEIPKTTLSTFEMSFARSDWRPAMPGTPPAPRTATYLEPTCTSSCCMSASRGLHSTVTFTNKGRFP